MGEEVQGRMEWGSRVELVGGLDKVLCNDSNLKNHSEKEEEPSGFQEYAKILAEYLIGRLHEKPSVSMWST